MVTTHNFEDYTQTQDSNGDLVLKDSNGTEVMRWDVSAGEWNIPAINTDKVTLPKKTIRVYPQGDPETAYDIEVTEQGTDADLIPTLQDVNDNQLSNQGTVVIGPGDYWVQNGDTLTWDNGGDIRGCGRNATIIRRVSSTTGYLIDVKSNGTTVADLTLNGNSGGEHGLRFDGAREASTERVTINQWGGRGFELLGGSYWHTARTLLVSDCNQSGLVSEQVATNHDGNGAPHACNFIACRVELGNSAAGVDHDTTGELCWYGSVIENNDGAGMKVRGGHGLYIHGCRFEGNNQATTESRVKEATSLTIAQESGFSTFHVTGRFTHGPNAEYSIWLGDSAEADSGVIEACRFADSPNTGNNIGVGEIGADGVDLRQNFYAGTAVSSFANGLMLNGIGSEATAGGTPTTSDWPTGAVVEDSDNPGTLYHLLPSGNWG